MARSQEVVIRDQQGDTRDQAGDGLNDVARLHASGIWHTRCQKLDLNLPQKTRLTPMDGLRIVRYSPARRRGESKTL
ncbi:MAG: hypothetical protein ACXVIG_07365 [Halobacteriota archaeon]